MRAYLWMSAAAAGSHGARTPVEVELLNALRISSSPRRNRERRSGGC
jgi:hypothetical protein